MPNKILIIDDHDWFRRLLRELLSYKFPQARLFEAGDAKSGMLLAETHLPDVVIMDVVLQGMSGIEATRWFKETMPAMPVIILSFHDEKNYRFASHEAGADEFVSKNYISTELIPLLQQLPVLAAQPANDGNTHP